MTSSSRPKVTNNTWFFFYLMWTFISANQDLFNKVNSCTNILELFVDFILYAFVHVVGFYMICVLVLGLHFCGWLKVNCLNLYSGSTITQRGFMGKGCAVTLNKGRVKNYLCSILVFQTDWILRSRGICFSGASL